MKLSVGLNTKSIKNAIKSLETAKKQLTDKMVEELLVACCVAILQGANRELDKLDLGDSVRRGIQSSWLISEVKNGTITLTNDWHKEHGKYIMGAAFIEFGVGIEGEKKPHEEAGEVGWQYNMPSDKKDDDGTWYFYTNDYDLDLPQSAIDKDKSKRYGGRLKVATQGTPATRFLYNAVMKFANEKQAKKIWQEIKAKYWG